MGCGLTAWAREVECFNQFGGLVRRWQLGDSDAERIALAAAKACVESGAGAFLSGQILSRFFGPGPKIRAIGTCIANAVGTVWLETRKE